MNKLIVGLLIAFLALSPAQAQNYSANQGTQITFSAASAAGILTPRFIFCDNTTPTQCLAVNPSGQVTVIAVPSGTYNVGGTVTANAVQTGVPWSVSGTVISIPSASPQSVFVNGAVGTALGTAVSSITGSPTLSTAYSSEPTKCTTADTCWPMVDLVGKQVTSPYAPRELALRCAVTVTGTAATTCTGMGAQGAGVNIYITDLCITRNDAGTTAATAMLNDSATTPVDVPNNGGGGGFCHTYNTPLVVAASNTAFQVSMSTSITSIHVSASGYKGY